MNQNTKHTALKALNGMHQIVEREMLIQGEYMEVEVSRPDLTTAVCGGRKHCAIGSLWAGGGVRALRYEYNPRQFYLPGVHEEERKDFLRPRHGLRAAYEALNDAATRFAKNHDIDLDDKEFEAPIEELFEHHYGDELTKVDLLRVINSAKRQIERS